jgi:hypothetical protein
VKVLSLTILAIGILTTSFLLLRGSFNNKDRSVQGFHAGRGCAGSTNAYHNCGSHELWQTDFKGRTFSELKGVFNKVNHGTRLAEVLDGLSQTVMLGEVQRLDDGDFETTSHDGWATGGVSTHFSLCGDGCRSPNKPHFETPGSHHIGGVNLVMTDGSVKFATDSIALELLEAIGGMVEGSTEQFED